MLLRVQTGQPAAHRPAAAGVDGGAGGGGPLLEFEKQLTLVTDKERRRLGPTRQDDDYVQIQIDGGNQNQKAYDIILLPC